MSKLTSSTPFTAQSKAILSDLLARLLTLYTRIIAQGDETAAQRALKLHQREQIAWERDTVWRTMLNQARHGENGTSVAGTSNPIVGAPTITNAEPEKALVDVRTPVGRLRITKKTVSLFIACAVGITLLNVQLIEGVEANRCFAVLVFCTIMWATEVCLHHKPQRVMLALTTAHQAIPLFVTSLCVPFLLVVLRVIRSPDDKHERLTTPDATKLVILLFLLANF
jgi:phosphate transporter